MIDLRSVRAWLADVLDALASRLQVRPVVVNPGELLEPLCPSAGCAHERGQHYAGSGRCLDPDCDCTRYAGPYPVDHLHVTTQPCDTCGVAGAHWAVAYRGQLLVVRSWQNLPPAPPGDGARIIPLRAVRRPE